MKILAVYNKDESIRKNSSSGGMFYALAKDTIQKGGVVFGARFDKNWEVEHASAHTVEEIKPFMQSKYVQSNIGCTYKEAKEFLDNGRRVLFSGTPCQIAALKKFLGKDYDNLITVDFICHGVPSRKVWREYLEELSGGKEIKAVNFRDKTQGWRVFSLKVEYADGSAYRKNLEEDVFIDGFLKNLYLRPSCYECQFRGIDREADVTLADFWGVQNVLPELYDDKGTSILIIRNDKISEQILDAKEQFVFEEVDADTVRKTNHALDSSCKPHPRRTEFFESDGKSVKKAIYKITKEPVKTRIKRKLYKILKGVK